MPLFDFTCPYCGHRFEVIAGSAGAPPPCETCFTPAEFGSRPWTEPEPRQALLIEARKLGVAHGRKARDGDDLENYGRQYGAEAAYNLVSDYWGSSYPPYKELSALGAKLLGVSPSEEVLWDIETAFKAGFVARCGDVYDDSYKRDEDEDV